MSLDAPIVASTDMVISGNRFQGALNEYARRFSGENVGLRFLHCMTGLAKRENAGMMIGSIADNQEIIQEKCR